jgi:anti-sigma B factor antagonist
MSVPPRSSEEALVLSPQEPLVAEGSADKFEEEVQALFREGHRHLVVDLRGVSRLDTTGICALVRGHVTAKRLGGSFKLVAPDQHVLRVLQLVRLDSVFEISESIESARARG